MAKFTLADGTEVEAFTADEVEARLAETTSGLKSKVEELLGESKSAKQKARELEERQAAEAEARAKEKGEFKELYEREQKAKAELAEKYSTFEKRIQQKEVEAAALSLAAEKTRDAKRMELIKKEVAQFAKYTDDGVKFEMGGVEVDKAKVLEHIETNYPFLVDGNNSTGGGATGARTGGAVKEIARADFEKKSPGEQSDYIRAGGKVI